MEIDEAIKLLKQHNAWRRDNTGDAEPVQPKKLGIAIDVIVSHFESENKHACITHEDDEEDYIECLGCGCKITLEDEYHYREGRCSDCI